MVVVWAVVGLYRLTTSPVLLNLVEVNTGMTGGADHGRAQQDFAVDK
jgi:hypothetical protein